MNTKLVTIKNPTDSTETLYPQTSDTAVKRTGGSTVKASLDAAETNIATAQSDISELKSGKVNVADVQDISSVNESLTSTTNPTSAHALGLMKAYVDSEVAQTIITPASGSYTVDTAELTLETVSENVQQIRVKPDTFAYKHDVDDLSAEVNVKLRNITAVESKVTGITDYIPEGETNSGHYKLVSNTPTWNNVATGSFKSTKIELPNGCTRVRFLGYSSHLYSYSGLYLFLDSDNNIIEYYSYYDENNPVKKKEFIVKVPENAKYFICEYKVWGGNEIYQCFQEDEFYCYLETGYEAVNKNEISDVLRDNGEIFEDNTDLYANDFSDIYICAELTNAIENISIKQNGGKFYFRAMPATNPFTCSFSLALKENGVVYELVVTTSGDATNYPEGKRIGYIVFKDISHFINNSNTADNHYINIQRAQKLYLQPTISAFIAEQAIEIPMIPTAKIVDGAVTNDKIADGAVTVAKIADGSVTNAKIGVYEIGQDRIADKYIIASDFYDIRGLIKELYLISDSITETYDGLNIKVYNDFLFVRPKNTSEDTYAWTSRTQITSFVDNVIYPLYVSHAGEESGFPVGTLVGYIIFSDIETLKTMSSGMSGINGIIENITNITQSPIINTYVKSLVLGTNLSELDTRVTALENGDTNEYPELQLPSNIYIVSGDELRIYYRSVLKTSTPDNYCIKVTDTNTSRNVGRPYPKYYWFKTDELGNYTLRFGIYNDNDVEVKSATTTIHVIASISSPATNKNVLVFGASATASGYIAGELRRRLTARSGYAIYSEAITLRSGETIKVKSFKSGKTSSNISSVSYGTADGTYSGEAAASGQTTTPTISLASNVATVTAESGAEIYYTLDGAEPIKNIHYNPMGLGLSNITFIGRQTGRAVNVPQEATGGWSWLDYSGEGRAAYRFYLEGFQGQLNIGQTYTQSNLTFTISEINIDTGTGNGNIRCLYSGSGTPAASGVLTRSSGGSGAETITYTSCESETFNPFYNNGALDFENYLSQYCDGATSIDVMISHCGMNDISNYTVGTMSNLFTDYIKPFVRAYMSYCENNQVDGKFIISTLPLPSPTGGMAANYGSHAVWNYLSIALRLYKFAELAWEMSEESEFSGFVYVADDVPVFDADNSYPTENAYVNTRSTTTEKRGTNGVHPLTAGSYQVSDAIYAVFNTLSW